MVDALGNPLDFILTGGQTADITQVYALVDGVEAAYALLDKAYDADKLIESFIGKLEQFRRVLSHFDEWAEN